MTENETATKKTHKKKMRSPFIREIDLLIFILYAICVAVFGATRWAGDTVIP